MSWSVEIIAHSEEHGAIFRSHPTVANKIGITHRTSIVTPIDRHDGMRLGHIVCIPRWSPRCLGMRGGVRGTPDPSLGSRSAMISVKSHESNLLQPPLSRTKPNRYSSLFAGPFGFVEDLANDRLDTPEGCVSSRVGSFNRYVCAKVCAHCARMPRVQQERKISRKASYCHGCFMASATWGAGMTTPSVPQLKCDPADECGRTSCTSTMCGKQH